MEYKLEIAQILKERQYRTLIDVRSPGEFEQAHIPGAKNIPLFDNDERAEVGTIYKQVNPQKALRRGLEIAAKKMNNYLDQLNALNAGDRLIVHCWRGGKRSRSMAWLFGIAGFDVLILKGGYKAYRRYVIDYFKNKKFPLIVIGGPTGSGKTEVLQYLKKMGEQVVDLERLANHKGSSFGALGEKDQPTVEQFENLLFEALYHLDTNRRIWIENESKSIGKVYLPPGFWKQKCTAPMIHLDIPESLRIERLVKLYAGFSNEQLIRSFQKIEKRLGGLRLKNAIEALGKQDFITAAKIALAYYDKSYQHAVANSDFQKIEKVKMAVDSPAAAAKKMKAIADTW